MMGHMKLNPRVTPAVIELVKRFEGLRRHAARLEAGGWTIGYGHVRFAREGAKVSPADAEALLVFDLSEVANALETMILAPVNAPQFEALTAFAFNIGVENFRHSTVLKWVNEGAYLQAAGAIELWRKAEFDGEDLVVDALVRRRAAEKAHFLTPPDGFVPTPSSVLHPAFDHAVVADAQAWVNADERAVVVQAPLEGPVASVSIAYPPGRHGEPAPLSEIAGTEAAAGLRPPAPPPAPPGDLALDPAQEAVFDEPPERVAAGSDQEVETAAASASTVEPSQDLHSAPGIPPEAQPEPGHEAAPGPAPAAEPTHDETLIIGPVDAPMVETPPPPEASDWARPALPTGRWTPPPRPDRPATVTPPATFAPPAALPEPAEPIAPPEVEDVAERRQVAFVAAAADSDQVQTTPLTVETADHGPALTAAAEAADTQAAPSVDGPPLFDVERPDTPAYPGLQPQEGFDLRREPQAIIRSELGYILLGLLGVMLFAGALVSMMRHANALNLFAGLVGVFFMAPSAGHFLLAFIGAGAQTEKA